MRLSKRSPTIENATVTSDSTTSVASAQPGDSSHQPATSANSAHAASAPYTPAIVLPGLIFGASLVVPNRRPAKYAPMSAHHTSTTTNSSQYGPRSGAPCSSTAAAHAGTTASSPASALTESQRLRGSEAKVKFLSHSGASIHHAAPHASATSSVRCWRYCHASAISTTASATSATRSSTLRIPI